MWNHNHKKDIKSYELLSDESNESDKYNDSKSDQYYSENDISASKSNCNNNNNDSNNKSNNNDKSNNKNKKNNKSNNNFISYLFGNDDEDDYENKNKNNKYTSESDSDSNSYDNKYSLLTNSNEDDDDDNDDINDGIIPIKDRMKDKNIKYNTTKDKTKESKTKENKMKLNDRQLMTDEVNEFLDKYKDKNHKHIKNSTSVTILPIEGSSIAIILLKDVPSSINMRTPLFRIAYQKYPLDDLRISEIESPPLYDKVTDIELYKNVLRYYLVDFHTHLMELCSNYNYIVLPSSDLLISSLITNKFNGYDLNIKEFNEPMNIRYPNVQFIMGKSFLSLSYDTNIIDSIDYDNIIKFYHANAMINNFKSLFINSNYNITYLLNPKSTFSDELVYQKLLSISESRHIISNRIDNEEEFNDDDDNMLIIIDSNNKHGNGQLWNAYDILDKLHYNKCEDLESINFNYDNVDLSLLNPIKWVSQLRNVKSVTESIIYGPTGLRWLFNKNQFII